MESDEKSEISLNYRVINVPNHLSIDENTKSLKCALYPGHFSHKERIPHLHLFRTKRATKFQTLILKQSEVRFKINELKNSYIMLESLPNNLAIREIVYYKPSTKEIQPLIPWPG